MIPKVFCYRNLNRKGVVYSIKSIKTGLVLDRISFLVLENAQFKVSQSGRQRVILNKKKNVHAGAVGFPMDYCEEWVTSKNKWRKVSYNPYKNSFFVYTRTNKKVGKIKLIALTKKGCFVK